MSGEGRIVRPIVLVGAPHCGLALLADALGRAQGLSIVSATTLPFPDEVDGPEAEIAEDGHRLTAAAATGDAGEQACDALLTALADACDGDLRPLLAGRRLGLRVPFLNAVLPDALFVFVHRDPAEALPAVVAEWRAATLASPGDPAPWLGPRVPGWRALLELPIDDRAAEQWSLTAKLVLDDLEVLAPERWCVLERAALIEDPRGELQRLCAFLDLRYDQALLTPVEEMRRAERSAGSPPREFEVAQIAKALEPVTERVAELIAQRPETQRPRRLWADRPGDAMRSVFTAAFARAVGGTGGSLLVSAPDAGRVICVRERERMVGTHLVAFERPAGVAAGTGRMTVAARTEIWELRDARDGEAGDADRAPQTQGRSPSRPGSHDAHLVPRVRLPTGDVGAVEVAWVGEELWLVSSALSCLATVDGERGLLARWQPPFVTSLAAEDRCHLSGMAAVDDRITHVTALGATDSPMGWQKDRATGGVLVRVADGESVAEGLCMPHSPRWHEGRLWLLEAGRGALCVADPDTGACDTVVELPGFARGLAFAGSIAFVGLSQMREPRARDDLPLTSRAATRHCGIWAIDLRRGSVLGFLRFEDFVREIADVALLPGARWPDITGAEGAAPVAPEGV